MAVGREHRLEFVAKRPGKKWRRSNQLDAARFRLLDALTEAIDLPDEFCRLAALDAVDLQALSGRTLRVVFRSLVKLQQRFHGDSRPTRLLFRAARFLSERIC